MSQRADTTVARAFDADPCTLDIAGRKIAYRQRRGPSDAAILLLHGLLDNSASFAALADALVARDPSSSIIAPDWRGHGHSDWTPGEYWFPNYLADLQTLLDRLTIDGPVVLVGHSMGGQIASLYAGACPERIAALVLLDTINIPDSDPNDAPARYRDWLKTRRAPPTPKTYADQETFTTRLARRYPELAPEQQADLARHWSMPTDDGRVQLRADPAHFHRNPYGFRAAEAKALWRQIDAPVLMLDGTESPAKQLTPADEMADRRACFKKLTHIEFEGLGHLLHVQAPDRLAQTITDFRGR